VKNHWLSKLKTDHEHLKQTMAMQALANYIVLTMSERMVDELVPYLQDPTKQVRVEITVTERKNDDA